MERQIKKLLQDIFQSVNSINNYLEGVENFSDYQKNKLVRRAVERELGIIGEAMNNLLKIQPDIPITSPKKIIGLRNLVIHAYDSLNNETIWIVAIKHLPILKKEVETLLQQKII